MKDEEILEFARSNPKAKEYENKMSTNGGLLGSAVALILGAVLYLLKYYVSKTADAGLLAVGMTAISVQLLYEGIKNKRVHLIVCGFTFSITAIISICAFIGQAVLQ